MMLFFSHTWSHLNYSLTTKQIQRQYGIYPIKSNKKQSLVVDILIATELHYTKTNQIIVVLHGTMNTIIGS